jgi:kynurenine 3-monooxygenase
MDEYMLSEAVPMFGRMIHSVSGDTKLLPYSGRKGEYINSVSRAGLNVALINEAEKYDGVQFIFGERCVDFDFKIGEVTFESGRTVRPDTTIATDGAGSAVRHAMQKRLENFDFTEKWLEHGYKELHIPPAANAESPFLIEPNALHIWPRHRFMMIALPNFDGSFTCTLFLDNTRRGDEPSFDQLEDGNSLLEFVSREFPDAVPLMPTLVDDFFQNPTGGLGTVKCWPWSIEDKVLLLGDSAHAMVPFYGQGMNCAFEDVRVLDQLIGQHGPDSATVYGEYGQLRKPNTDAIADMAEENFYEMRDATADPVFQRKRELETKLEQTFPDYFSKYSLVTFREDVPYTVAKERGNKQDRLLMNICNSVESVDELDLQQVMNEVAALASPATDV